MRKENFMDFFCNKYGLIKSWVAKQLGISAQAFFLLTEGGLPESRAEQVTAAIRAAGRQLQKETIPKEAAPTLERIRAQCGIKKAFWAAQLGVSTESFLSLIRDRELRPDEIERLEQARKDIARAFLAFDVPPSIRKAA
jgi:hypothetical protein